jgi:hypothetical protein
VQAAVFVSPERINCQYRVSRACTSRQRSALRHQVSAPRRLAHCRTRSLTLGRFTRTTGTLASLPPFVLPPPRPTSWHPQLPSGGPHAQAIVAELHEPGLAPPVRGRTAHARHPACGIEGVPGQKAPPERLLDLFVNAQMMTTAARTVDSLPVPLQHQRRPAAQLGLRGLDAPALCAQLDERLAQPPIPGLLTNADRPGGRLDTPPLLHRGQEHNPSSTIPSQIHHVTYLAAKRRVIESGFAWEILWQSKTVADDISPESFVREAAWVVLCSGMREATIRRVFEALEAALCDFNPHELLANRDAARAAALATFRHERKIDAILDIASIVAPLGADQLRTAVREDAEGFLQSLPYIGPITWRHLAKNLGLEMSKPDRHLQRFAAAASRSSVDALCQEISSWLDEPIRVVDVVLWRWCALHALGCSRSCGPFQHLVQHARDHENRGFATAVTGAGAF